MISWYKVIIKIEDEVIKENMSAMLMFNGAESVVDQDDYLEVYLHQENKNSLLDYISNQAIFSPYKIKHEAVENTNWNAVWESSFQPIDVGDIHIRAEFHPPTAKTEIVIQPKMAFGTGHHETTYMMIEKMSSIDFSNKKVLDYGCGTGILAVYAGMLNAQQIEANDIQPEAIENTIEHFDLNNVSRENLKVLEGDLDVFNSGKYDIILANINRHVLLDNGENLYAKLKSQGTLLMSGILKSDRELILSIYKKLNFELKSENSKGEWCLFEFAA